MNDATTVPGPAERLRRVLSYGQAQAVRAILDVMHSDVGVVTNSALADDLGMTRSVMVQALRLCEAAGVLETRSLGMKGTHIRIHDRPALEQAVGA